MPPPLTGPGRALPLLPPPLAAPGSDRDHRLHITNITLRKVVAIKNITFLMNLHVRLLVSLVLSIFSKKGRKLPLQTPIEKNEQTEERKDGRKKDVRKNELNP